MPRIKKIILFMILIAALLSACYFPNKRNTIINYKNRFAESNILLRTDGYYFCNAHNIELSRSRQFMIFFLYRDGIFKMMKYDFPFKYDPNIGRETSDYRFDLSCVYDSFDKLHEATYQYLLHNCYKDNKDEIIGWGRYYLAGDSVVFAYYDYGPAGAPLPVLEYELIQRYGRIRQDSTIVIPDGLLDTPYEVYRFHACQFKPDSCCILNSSKTFRYKWWPGFYTRFLEIF